MRVDPTAFPLTAAQLGIAAAIVSLTFFFGGLVIAYGIRIESERNWTRFELPSVLWLSCLFLLLSSLLLETARRALRRALVPTYRGRMLGAIVLAGLFFGSQSAAALDLVRQGVAARGNPHGAAFYVFMTIHGAHMTVGLIWLIALFWTAAKLSDASENDLRRHRRKAQVAAVYWHYMGFLWLVLFGFLHRWTL